MKNVVAGRHGLQSSCLAASYYLRAIIVPILLAASVSLAMAQAQQRKSPHFIPESLDDPGQRLPPSKPPSGYRSPLKPAEAGSTGISLAAPVPGLNSNASAPVQQKPLPPAQPVNNGEVAAPNNAPKTNAPKDSGWQSWTGEGKLEVNGPGVNLETNTSGNDISSSPIKLEATAEVSVLSREIEAGDDKIKFSFGNGKISVFGQPDQKANMKYGVEMGASAFQIEATHDKIAVQVEVLKAQAEASVKIDVDELRAKGEIGASLEIIKTTATANFPVGIFDISIGGHVGVGAAAKMEGDVDLKDGKAKYGIELGFGPSAGFDFGIAIQKPKEGNKPAEPTPVRQPYRRKSPGWTGRKHRNYHGKKRARAANAFSRCSSRSVS